MPRAVEILLTVALLILAVPFAIIVALAVRVELGDPILFRQVRSGHRGKRITIVKFRSMNDTRGACGDLLPDADRTGPVGRAIRRYRLDEIPQLLSVLRGDTALVGPRPLLPQAVESFDLAGDMRGMVRPGLTGWAQVNGNSRLNDSEKVSLDLWYVYHRDACFDFMILAMTALTLLRGETRAEARILVASTWLRDCTNCSLPELASLRP